MAGTVRIVSPGAALEDLAHDRYIPREVTGGCRGVEQAAWSVGASPWFRYQMRLFVSVEIMSLIHMLIGM